MIWSRIYLIVHLRRIEADLLRYKMISNLIDVESMYLLFTLSG